MQLDPNGKCALHNEDFEFYCKNCEQLICVSCVEEHTDLGHGLRKLEKAFPLIDEKCRASEERLKQRKQTIDMQLQARKDAKKAADKNGERAVKQLLDAFERVDEIVAARSVRRSRGRHSKRICSCPNTPHNPVKQPPAEFRANWPTSLKCSFSKTL